MGAGIGGVLDRQVGQSERSRIVLAFRAKLVQSRFVVQIRVVVLDVLLLLLLFLFFFLVVLVVLFLFIA